MNKILFHDLVKLMKEQGKVERAYFELEEFEIRRNDWIKNPGGYSRLSNSEYNVAFFSKIENNEIYINVDKIMGQTQFLRSTYAPNTFFGGVALRILSENGFDFLHEKKICRVGKNYQGDFRAMNDYDDIKQIKNKDELKITLENLIRTQNQIINMEKGFEKILYQLSKK